MYKMPAVIWASGPVVLYVFRICWVEFLFYVWGEKTSRMITTVMVDGYDRDRERVMFSGKKFKES